MNTPDIFSGSGILDSHNVTGLGTEENPPALLYYTGTTPFSQHLAYSTDGFNTVKKYDMNPILPHIAGNNRDPKVVFCEECNAFVMALYLEKDIYAFLMSRDLLSWKLVQKLPLAGDSECPDIFSIIASDGKKKWVFMGAHNKYLVGTMTENGFNSEQEVHTLHYGSSAYAGQTFSGIPNGRIVRIDWDKWPRNNTSFCGQMSIPLELNLNLRDGIYYLSASPVKELECLFDKKQSYSGVKIEKGCSVSYKLESTPYFIRLSINDFNETPSFTIKVFGRDLIMNPAENELKFGKETLPLSIFNDSIDITLVIDKCSIEAFLDEGKIYESFINNNSVSDYNVPFIEISSAEDVNIDNLELISLKSIWN